MVTLEDPVMPLTKSSTNVICNICRKKVKIWTQHALQETPRCLHFLFKITYGF